MEKQEEKDFLNYEDSLRNLRRIIHVFKRMIVKYVEVGNVRSDEYRELKAEIETIKKQIAKLEKELLSVKRLAQEALETAAML
ncbi:MAG: hypothetical protein QXZ70_05960 [Candidatus Bathyarchaeia archaeon]